MTNMYHRLQRLENLLMPGKVLLFSVLATISAITLHICAGSALADYNPFADKVIDISLNAGHQPKYLPSPSQFTNDAYYDDANKALGTPTGGGTLTPDNSSVVSLGGFGGQMVLAFDHDVEDNPANPMGLDAIIFSNAGWVWGDPNYHWTEPATIEIMPELNGNSTPGDDPNEKWYLILGSDINDTSTYRTENWTRGMSLPPFVSYPGYTGWPDQYDTAAYELLWNYQTLSGTDGIVVNPNHLDGDPNNNNKEGHWGYAEYTPTLKIGDRDADNDNEGFGDANDLPPELFYTNPDNPLTVGISPGTGGGDAFDIKWAVDQDTWQLAHLKSFRYIRLTCAVDLWEPAFGEISSEIDSVADIRPTGDLNGNGDVNFTDLDLVKQSWMTEWGQPDFNPAADLNADNKIDFLDYALFAWGYNHYHSEIY